jgi:Myotubularin-like phosphatase domain
MPPLRDHGTVKNFPRHKIVPLCKPRPTGPLKHISINAVNSGPAEGVQKAYLVIDNIHSMRDSLNKVIEVLRESISPRSMRST